MHRRLLQLLDLSPSGELSALERSGGRLGSSGSVTQLLRICDSAPPICNLVSQRRLNFPRSVLVLMALVKSVI